MKLSFQTKWANGTPNYFIEKFWYSLLPKEGTFIEKLDFFYKMEAFSEAYFYKVGNDFSSKPNFHPKKHTLREDKKNRWKAGNKIHPVINNRTKNEFQFTPIVYCKSVQNVKITNFFIAGSFKREIYIDSKLFYQLYPKKSFLHKLNSNRMLEFVKNDGFEDISSFFEYFFPKNQQGTKELKLIHWTDLTY